MCSDSLVNVEQWTVIGSDSYNDDEWWVVSLINNASAVILYFVLNSRHNIHISRLWGSLYIGCREWEWEWMGIEVMEKMRLGMQRWNGNGWEWEWEWFDGSGKEMGIRKSFLHANTRNPLIYRRHSFGTFTYIIIDLQNDGRQYRLVCTC